MAPMEDDPSDDNGEEGSLENCIAAAKQILGMFEISRGQQASAEDNWAGSAIGQIMEKYTRLDEDMQQRPAELVKRVLQNLQRELQAFTSDDFAQPPETVERLLPYVRKVIAKAKQSLDHEWEEDREMGDDDDAESFLEQQATLETGGNFDPLRSSRANIARLASVLRELEINLQGLPVPGTFKLPLHTDIVRFSQFYDRNFPCSSDGQVFDSRAQRINEECTHYLGAEEAAIFRESLEAIGTATHNFIDRSFSMQSSTKAALYNTALKDYGRMLEEQLETIAEAFAGDAPPHKKYASHLADFMGAMKGIVEEIRQQTTKRREH